MSIWYWLFSWLRGDAMMPTDASAIRRRTNDSSHRAQADRAGRGGTGPALPGLGGERGDTPGADHCPDSAIHASTITVGGAKMLPTTRTVAHWFGTALNPGNGVTYGFNMVGADPALEQSTTITADIVPVNVVINGQTFSGTRCGPADARLAGICQQ